MIRDETADDEEEEIEEEDEDDEKSRFNDDEEIFDMDNINQDEKPKPLPLSNPKSFVAVTSTERIRKISVVKNDFRPIDKPQFGDSNNPMTLSSSSSSSGTKRTSKDESATEESKGGSSSTSKRRRKKRSIMKRKSVSRKISGSDADTSQGKDAASVGDKSQLSTDKTVKKFLSRFYPLINCRVEIIANGLNFSGWQVRSNG